MLSPSAPLLRPLRPPLTVWLRPAPRPRRPRHNPHSFFCVCLDFFLRSRAQSWNNIGGRANPGRFARATHADTNAFLGAYFPSFLAKKKEAACAIAAAPRPAAKKRTDSPYSPSYYAGLHNLNRDNTLIMNIICVIMEKQWVRKCVLT